MTKHGTTSKSKKSFFILYFVYLGYPANGFTGLCFCTDAGSKLFGELICTFLAGKPAMANA
jgi:hypothetical protein